MDVIHRLPVMDWSAGSSSAPRIALPPTVRDPSAAARLERSKPTRAALPPTDSPPTDSRAGRSKELRTASSLTTTTPGADWSTGNSTVARAALPARAAPTARVPPMRRREGKSSSVVFPTTRRSPPRAARFGRLNSTSPGVATTKSPVPAPKAARNSVSRLLEMA